MAAKNLTEEFHDLIFSDNYATTIEQPETSDCINSSELYHLRKYTNKTCNLITNVLIDKNGQAIPSGVFQIFSTYSRKMPGDIRDNLLRWASKWEEEVCNLAKNYFKYEHLNFTSWYIRTLNINKAVDETTLFLLCKQYSRHAILVNCANYWSTLNPSSNLSEYDAYAKCDLGLVHLGTHKYVSIECKGGYSIYDTVEKIREFFNRHQTNTKLKLERDQKLSECAVHQNRSKRQKCDVNYLELNIGKSVPQPKPKGKSRTKKIDIVAALRELSETRLAAYQIQKERQHSNPGDVIGTIIKTEIKSEVEIKLECVNTRHKYKNRKFPLNPNYIHVDGTPCRSTRKKANELLATSNTRYTTKQQHKWISSRNTLPDGY